MTAEIGILFSLLVGMSYLFFTEKLPVDLTAFIGLVILVFLRFLTPEEAFTGFASPAVITMLSIFFVSAAMLHTGLADMIGARVHGWIGDREVPLIVAIMLVGGVLSAFMNNIAATAVLMPAVASICRKTGISPSRLFMPLSFGAILGGTTTLVGTPPNILAADMLRERGLEPFQLFDFTPVGLVLLFIGIIFMATLGRRLLPKRDIGSSGSQQKELARAYGLEENLLSIEVPSGSNLDGLSLRDTRLGTALGVQVVGIERDGKKELAPSSDAVLKGGDVLLVKGRYQELEELLRVQGVEIGEVGSQELPKADTSIGAVTAILPSDSAFVDKTLQEMRFRHRFGVVVVGLRRGGKLLSTDLAREKLRQGDEILAIGESQNIERLVSQPGVVVSDQSGSTLEDLKDHLFFLRIPGSSSLAGTNVAQSRIGELVGLTVVGIIRGEETVLGVQPEDRIEADDKLLVTGEPERIQRLLSLGNVDLAQNVSQAEIQSEEVGVIEATVAPRSNAAGRTLSELDFREKFGLQALAIWREGAPIHEGLARVPLRFGDALLLQGPWQKFQLFARDRNFVVLSASLQEPRRTNKAIYAVGALLMMVIFVITGFQPIHVAAFTAAVAVVLSGAISMEEAYRAVEWRAVFLVAAILPVGIAMERTGAASLISETVTSTAGPLGSYAVLAGLFSLSSMLSQALDGAPAVVLLTPVAIEAAQKLNMSIYPVMMGISLAASAAFMTPFSHKANLLVMGAGGYRVQDYLKVGTPLTIIIMIVMVLLVPVFFPV